MKMADCDIYRGHLVFNVLYRKISKLLKLKSAVALYFNGFQVSWESSISQPCLVTYSSRSLKNARKCSYPNPGHVCITLRSKSVATWFVCLCIAVVFQFSECFNFSFLLSKPSEALQNVKGRVQIDATYEILNIKISYHLVCLPLYFSSVPSLRAFQFFILVF